MALPPLAPCLPDNCEPLEHQVAGHMYGKGKTGFGCLKGPDGVLLKPVQAPPRGTQELNFYEIVYDKKNTEDSSLGKIRRFMPEYYGTLKCVKSDQLYLKLEDATDQYSKPNVMDIKIGALTHHPDHEKATYTPEYRKKVHDKFPPRLDFGYCISGSRVYDPEVGDYVVYDKFYFRRLEHEEMIISQGLEKYFWRLGSRRNEVIQKFIDKLEEIQDWFETHTDITFYSSSLLFISEGNPSVQGGSDDNPNKICRCQSIRASGKSDSQINGTENSAEGDKKQYLCSGSDCLHVCGTRSGLNVQVKMIDFTHTYFEKKKDENYLIGLRTLISHLKKMNCKHHKFLGKGQVVS